MTQTVCPAIEDVDAIAGIAEPILRNLRITSTYAQLSRAFAVGLPGGANWCTFATWASRQAGCTIRKEDLARTVARKLQQRLVRRPILRDVHRIFGISGDHLSSIVGELSQALPGIDRASDAVARGNRKVFEEIGREFARFVTGGEEGHARFTDGLRSGPPPDGQDMLGRAFGSYLQARETSEPGVRAELMLFANVQIGLHEQTRLQPEIREAMDAALLDVADTRRLVLNRLHAMAAAGPLGHIRNIGGHHLLNAAADAVSEDLRIVVRMVTTERLMTIGLPGNRLLHLGADVTGPFPHGLETLTHAGLIALLADFDTTPDTASGSAAIDWSVLAERVHFIADFFRAYHADASLFDPPFEAGQLDAIDANRVPDRV